MTSTHASLHQPHQLQGVSPKESRDALPWRVLPARPIPTDWNTERHGIQVSHRHTQHKQRKPPGCSNRKMVLAPLPPNPTQLWHTPTFHGSFTHYHARIACGCSASALQKHEEPSLTGGHACTPHHPHGMHSCMAENTTKHHHSMPNHCKCTCHHPKTIVST